MSAWRDLYEFPQPPRFDRAFDEDRPPAVEIDHPLLDRLRDTLEEFDRESRAQSGKRRAEIGLLIDDPPERRGYWCTPVNSVSFAGTGGDGTHFSLVAEPGPGGLLRIDESCPVVMTCPANGPPANIALGDSLRDFLRFGLTRGYFGLQALQLYPDEALAAYNDPDREVTEEKYVWNGLGEPDHEDRAVLDRLRERLDLEPLSYTPEHFADLQRRHAPGWIFGPEAAELWAD